MLPRAPQVMAGIGVSLSMWDWRPQVPRERAEWGGEPRLVRRLLVPAQQSR